MHQKLSDIITVISKKEEENSFNLRAILKRYFYHWPLFLIGIVLCITGAFLYVKNLNPIFTITTSIIIKDGRKEADQKNNLQELYLSNSPKLVENEIEVLRSRRLIGQVVADLKLWVNYQSENETKITDLYKKSPVSFRLINPSDNIQQDINVKVKDDHAFYLKDKNGEFKEFLFKNVLRNNIGTWQLVPTENLQRFKGKEIKIVVNKPDQVAQEYQDNIKIEQTNKLASTITVRLKDEIEQRGKDILNDLVRLYNETSIAEKNLTTKRTLEFIDDRISSLVGELNNSEANIEGYRSSRGITDISSQSKVYLENVQANDNKMNEVNVQLNIVDGIDRYLNSPQNSQYVPSTLGIADPLLNNSIEKLSQLNLQREKLLATTPETNPDFEVIDRQIQATKHSIKENMENVKSSLLLTRDKLLSFNSKYESSIKNVPVQERQLIDKTRQQNIKENLYVYLLQKREEVGLNYSSILSDARIVDYAYSNTNKTKKPIIYGIAFFLGILLPAGFIFGRSSLNNRVITGKEIEDATGLSIIGELSYATAPSALVNPDNNFIISEDFRKLRTDLNLLKVKSDTGWVTLITSSISNEGKSFVSSNLGYYLAASGKKTILLEMDWRRPKIARIFNLSESQTGVSNYLAGELTFDELVQKSTVHPNLDIVGSGPLPESPVELLDSEKINSLIEWLKINYDHIIIDSPPVNLVADAKILSKFSDTILYVIRQAYTFKHLLTFIKSLSKREKFGNMKIVFNGIESGKFGYGNNYGNNYYKVLANKKNYSLNLTIQRFFKRF